MKYGDITLGQTEALFNRLGGETAVRRILADELIVRLEERVRPEPEPLPSLLAALPPIEIPALDRFEVKKRIKVGVDGTVYVSPEFHTDFDGMVEDARLASTIYPHSNTRPARYAEMRKELGEGKIVKATLGQIAYLARNGGLLADGRANLFEVVNRQGVPRLVGVRWRVWFDDFGWYWYSCSVGSSFGWYAGRQVFSGNPRPETSDTQTPA